MPSKGSFHSTYDAAYEEQSFTLPDGRELGFAEYGIRKQDPSAPVVIYFHGAPGSRYDGIGYDYMGRKLGARIITPDRPGHGLSTFQDNRSLLDYPKDIQQLAKHLGVKKYHVMGGSGGGPYVIACAYSLPKDELLNAAVVAGMGPPEILTIKDAGLYTMLALWCQNNIPGLLTRINEWSYPPDFLADDARLQKSLDRLFNLLPEKDRYFLTRPGTPPILRATLRAAMAQGYQGTISDGQIYWNPWGFKLEDVQNQVLLFFGKKDNRTPVAFGRCYQAHLGGGSELFEFEHASHFSIGVHREEILGRVLGKEVRDGKVVGLQRDLEHDRKVERDLAMIATP